MIGETFGNYRITSKLGAKRLVVTLGDVSKKALEFEGSIYRLRRSQR